MQQVRRYPDNHCMRQVKLFMKKFFAVSFNVLHQLLPVLHRIFHNRWRSHIKINQHLRRLLNPFIPDRPFPDRDVQHMLLRKSLHFNQPINRLSCPIQIQRSIIGLKGYNTEVRIPGQWFVYRAFFHDKSGVVPPEL